MKVGLLYKHREVDRVYVYKYGGLVKVDGTEELLNQIIVPTFDREN